MKVESNDEQVGWLKEIVLMVMLIKPQFRLYYLWDLYIDYKLLKVFALFNWDWNSLIISIVIGLHIRLQELSSIKKIKTTIDNNENIRLFILEN